MPKAIERANQHLETILSNDCYISAICKLIIAAGDNLADNQPVELAVELIQDMASDMTRHSISMLRIVESSNACEPLKRGGNDD